MSHHCHQLFTLPPFFRKLLGRLGWTVLGVLAGLTLLALLLRWPLVQTWVARRAATYLSTKSGMLLDLQRLSLSYRGHWQIDNLKLLTAEGDTVVYAPRFVGRLSWWELPQRLHFDSLEAVGWVVRLKEEETGQFNFDPLLEVFESEGSTDTSSSLLPLLHVAGLKLKDADLQLQLKGFALNSRFEALSLQAFEGELNELAFSAANFQCENGNLLLLMPDQSQAYQIGLLTLNHLYILPLQDTYKLASSTAKDIRIQIRQAERSQNASSQTTSPFELPNLKVQSGKLDIRNLLLVLQTGNVEPSPGVFNADYQRWQTNYLVFDSLNYSGDQARLDGLRAKLCEEAGWELDLRASVDADRNALQITGFDAKTANSELHADVRLDYASPADMVNAYENLAFELQMSENSSLAIEDAAFFAPQLEREPSIQPLFGNPVAVQGNLIGSFSQIQASAFQLNWRNSSSTLQGSYTANDLGFPTINLSNFVATVTRNDLRLWVPEEGFTYPESLTANGLAKVDPSNITLTAELSWPGGIALLDGHASQWANDSAISYQLEAGLHNLPLGQILADSTFGQTSFVLSAKGRGSKPETAQFEADIDFLNLPVYDYDYGALEVKARLDSGNLSLIADHNSPELQLALGLNGTIASTKQDLKLQVRLDLAKPDALRWSDELKQLSFQLTGELHRDTASMAFVLALDSLHLQDAQKSYYPGGLLIDASSQASRSWLKVASKLVSGSAEANVSAEKAYATALASLSQHLPGLLPKPHDTLSRSTQASASFTFYPVPTWQELLPFYLGDTASVEANLKGGDLRMQANLPQVTYGDGAMKAFTLQVDSDSLLVVKAGFEKLDFSPAAVGPTRLAWSGNSDNFDIELELDEPSGKPIYRLATHSQKDAKGIYTELLPEGLMLDGRPWSKLNDAPQGDRFRNFALTSGKEKFIFTDEGEEYVLRMTDFGLVNLSSLLRADTAYADGVMNGVIRTSLNEKELMLLSDFRIDSLQAAGLQLGTLVIDAVATDDRYRLQLSLDGQESKLDMAAFYSGERGVDDLEAELTVERLNLSPLVLLSDSVLREANGYLQGRLTLAGSLQQLRYAGELHFAEADAYIAPLNSRYHLGNETITFDETKIQLSRFVLTDEKERELVLNGFIRTPESGKQLLDLSLSARDFQLLNATKSDNPLLYGQARANADIRLTGTPINLVIDGKVRLSDSSRITLVVPESEVDVVERDGVVIFSRYDPATDSLEDEQPVRINPLSGIRIRSTLELTPKSELKLVLDERSGDHLLLSGKAALVYEQDPNGQTRLAGTYEISKGSYELSMYELARRKFELVPGGRVIWSGDPMKARLDLQALYRVKTGAADLMSTQLSVADEALRQRYRQELPFELYLNIGGELLKPSLSFRLDMPEQQRAALDGNVYGRIQQLNQDEAELNKQVFSLLVLNRFVPAGLSSNPQAGGAATGLARSSASQLLSGQLNQLSAQYFRQVELNVNLDTYQEYQSGSLTDHTQLQVNLRKQLFDNRLVLELERQVDLQGSSSAGQDLVGNVNVEYLLNPEGTLRLRGFRRQQPEGLVEGPLTITGMALVLNREFNGFDELLKRKKEKEAAKGGQP